MNSEEQVSPRSRPINNGYFCPETRLVTIDARADDTTTREIDFLFAVSGLRSGGTVLDVGCGAGRQSIALARRGCRVVGVDKSVEFLAVAAERAQQAGLSVEFRHADAREMDFTDRFDLAVSFYTAFGYHDDDGNRLVVERIVQALRTGGHFVLDVTNRDAVAQRTTEVKVTRANGLTVVKENHFDPYTSRRRLDWTYLEGDLVTKRVAMDHRLYALHELLRLFGESGLDDCNAYADLDLTPFHPGSRRLLIVGAKRQ
ncbi:MAG TPA: class I SAM-dependent methyltransferase [Pseudonocardiaceae bacterium]|jgi:SAM-dependent methyltransferase